MTTINAENYNGDFSALLRETAEYGDRLNVWTSSGSLVVISEEEYRGILETARINANPALRRKLLDGVNTPESECLPASMVDF